MLIDSHCHLQFPELIHDIESTLTRCAESSIEKFVVNGTHPEDWDNVLKLAEQFPTKILPAIGLHPWRVIDRPEGWEHELKALISSSPSIALGEIGLDRWINQRNLADQRRCFLFQLSLAAEFNRPVSIHCLKAWGSLLECLEETELPERGIHIHSFGGSREIFNQLKKYNPYYSFSGYFLQPRKKAIADLYLEVPLDRLLIETDAPSMLPPAKFQAVPHESINFPENLSLICEGLAQLKGISPSSLAEQTSKNALCYFWDT